MTIYGFIGVGSIAASTIVGLCDGVVEAPAIVLSPRSRDRSATLAARFPTVRVATTNQEVVDVCDTVVLSVLPQDAEEVLQPLIFRSGQAIISAMAAIDVSTLEHLVEPADNIARSIPAPAVATATSVTPIHPATAAARELYSRLGGYLEIGDERALESISAASATVEAYFHYLSAVSDWLSDHGVASADARKYVSATFRDLAVEMETPNVDFDALARAHTSEGGLNEQFTRHLTANGTFDAVSTGLDAVLARISPA